MKKKKTFLPKLNHLPPKPTSMWTEFSKDQVEDLIDECKGIISLMVLKTGFNYK